MRLSLSVVRKYAPIRWCALNRERNLDPAHRLEHTISLSRCEIQEVFMGFNDLTWRITLHLHESVIRGHHVYKSVWSPTLGEIVSVDHEHGNTPTVTLFVCWKETQLLAMLPENWQSISGFSLDTVEPIITYPSQQSLGVERESLQGLIEIVVLSVELHNGKPELFCVALSLNFLLTCLRSNGSQPRLFIVWVCSST